MFIPIKVQPMPNNKYNRQGLTQTSSATTFQESSADLEIRGVFQKMVNKDVMETRVYMPSTTVEIFY